ncbi:MAG TPA: TldD/PmbA family protein [Candidatus Gallacutalibacter stercoravium]|nr:TldD/PmbA family protein [Candidatus Gallacutalibacter stercoravium]
MQYEDFKNAVIAAAQQAGITEYELYSVSNSSLEADTFRQELDGFSSSISGGVCLRCIVDGKMGYSATELLNEEQAALLVTRAAENARTIDSADPSPLYQGGGVYASISPTAVPAADAQQLIDSALACQKKAYGLDARVADGTSSSFCSAEGTVRIYNSHGVDLQNTIRYGAGFVQAVVEDSGEKYTGFSYLVGDTGRMDFDLLAQQAVDKAVATIGAVPMRSGKYPVVIDKEQMINLLGTFCSVFSAENAQQGLSLLQGKEGETIAAPCVTLTDDPLYPGSYVPAPFDAEGVPTQCKNIVQQGVLQTLLHNLKTAHKAGIASTGNAAKGGYSSNISIAPYTFYLQPGNSTAEQLMQQAGNGVYLTELKGLHAGANAVTGDFSLESSGFLIQDGQKGAPVRSFTVAGNFFELLRQVEAVGNDLAFDMPSGFTVFGSPSVLIRELSVAGNEA